MAIEQIESITNNMIPEELRINKPISKPIITAPQSRPAIRSTPIIDQERLPPTIIKRYFKEQEPNGSRIRPEIERHIAFAVPVRQFNTKAEYLKSLDKGDVVCLRGWSLGPFESVGVVWRHTPGLIILTNGKRFDRNDGLSVDGSKLMLTPLTEKAKRELVKKQRDRLHCKEAA